MAEDPSHPEYYLAVDTGATKTHGLLTDERGNVLALAAGGPGNPHAIGGFQRLAGLLSDLVGEACREAKISTSDIRSAGFGLAGLDWPSEKEDFVRILKGIGLPHSMGLVNDAALGIFAGTSQGWGVCLTAGTSFNSRGRTADGREGRAVGDGLYWGEGAGAEELVIRAAQAVVAEWTMRGPETRITDLFMDHFQAGSHDELVEGLVRRHFRLTASLAPDIIRLTETSDRIAKECVLWAAGKLAKLAEGVINQLDLKDSPFELVLAGGFFQAGNILISPLTNTIHTIALFADVKLLNMPPVCGGILLALEVIGKDCSSRMEVKENLKAYFNNMKSLSFIR